MDAGPVDPSLRPFRAAVPDAALEDLRRRLHETRWPEPETVDDDSQGVRLAPLQALCGAWARHDWRATEARLDRLPQLLTTVDGLDLHLVHRPSSHARARPLILTHGWPGSFLEFETVVEALAEPPDPRDAFHVVVPSLPGYGFSGRPAERGWDVHRIASAWVTLMARLGYERFVAGGSDWGTSISTAVALRQPERLLGLHLVPPLVAPSPSSDGPRTDAERAGLAELADRQRTASAYSEVQRTRPQTIGYGLVDSPVALAAWMVEKLWSWTDRRDGAGLTTSQVLDGLSLAWLTGTGASAARLYWESIEEVAGWFAGDVGDRIDVPTGCTVFPREVPRPSRRWAERRFGRITHWGEPARGGHFGAWEQPEAFVAELRAFARTLPTGPG